MLVYALCLPLIVIARIDHEHDARRTRRRNAWLAERAAYLEDGWTEDELPHRRRRP